MQPNQMGAPVSTSEQSKSAVVRWSLVLLLLVYRAQTNSPAPSNVPPSTLNKSPHGNTPGGLYPPSSNASVTPSLQQQRSPAGSVPSPSPSGPMTSSISPHANPSNAPMNKASTPQPAMSQQQQQQHRPYLPPQGMMQQQQQPNRVMNGDPSTGQPTNSYPQGQPSYMPQTPQQQHSYPMQQNGYGHHPNGGMPQQHYPMYHQQSSKRLDRTEPLLNIDVSRSDPNMAVPPNQIAKPNSPLNGQQQSIIPAPSSPKPSSSSSPSQASNTQNLVANQQQQQQMAYNSYGGQQPQAMYHPQQNYHMQQQQQQQWQNQPRMMMQPQYAPYPQGQYPAAPPQSWPVSLSPPRMFSFSIRIQFFPVDFLLEIYTYTRRWETVQTLEDLWRISLLVIQTIARCLFVCLFVACFSLLLSVWKEK